MPRLIGLPWDSQPQEAVQLARNGLTQDIGWCLPLNGSDQEIVRGGRLTRAAAGTYAPDPLGLSLRGNGAAACASIPIDLSPFSQVTVSFWMYWDAYANNDKLAMEHGANFATNSGFLIDPNSSAPAAGEFQVAVGSPGRSNAASFARPSAAVWHHYMFCHNRDVGAVQANSVFVNGIQQSLTDRGTAAIVGNFGNNNLFIFSRNNSSLFGAGRMLNLVIRPQIIADAALAREEYLNPWALYEDRQIYVPTAAAASGLPTLSASTFVPGSVTSTGWRPRVTATY